MLGFRTWNGGGLERSLGGRRRKDLKRGTETKIFEEKNLIHCFAQPPTTPCWGSGLNCYKSLIEKETSSACIQQTFVSCLNAGQGSPGRNESR